MSLLPQPILAGSNRQMTIGSLFGRSVVSSTQSQERMLLCYVLPPWQRDEVWDMPRKRAFVEGIFLGLGTGFYVVHEPDWNSDGTPKPMSGWLIDGQQRLAALRDFVDDRLEVFDGVRYSQVGDIERRKRFLNQPFPSIEIPYTSSEALLRGLYERLNFSGRVAHTEADLERLRDTPMIQVEPESSRYRFESNR